MKNITQEFLKECFDYCPESGVLTWKNRVGQSNSWNTRYAYKVAGSITSYGYLEVGILGVSHRAHRVIWCLMTGAWPEDQIDHINHIRLDNRWANLREASHQENHKNRSISSKNTSGVVDVSWDKQTQKWRAKIHADGKQMHLGRFGDIKEAISARHAAEIKHGFHENHGQGANAE